jgi:hypothetical protein
MINFNNPNKIGILYPIENSKNMGISGNIGDPIYAPYYGRVEVTDINNTTTDNKCNGMVMISHEYKGDKIYSKLCYVDKVLVKPGDIVDNNTQIGSLGNKSIIYSVSDKSNKKYRIKTNGLVEFESEKKINSDKSKSSYSSREYKTDSSYVKKQDNDSRDYSDYYSTIPIQALLSPLSVFGWLGKKAGKEAEKNKIISDYKKQGYRKGKPRNYTDATGDMIINLKTKHPESFKSDFYMHKDLRIEKRKIVKSYESDGFKKTKAEDVNTDEYILINLKEKYPVIFEDDFYMKKRLPQKSFFEKKFEDLKSNIMGTTTTTTTTTLNPTVTEDINRIKFLIESFTKK